MFELRPWIRQSWENFEGEVVGLLRDVWSRHFLLEDVLPSSDRLFSRRTHRTSSKYIKIKQKFLKCDPNLVFGFIKSINKLK